MEQFIRNSSAPHAFIYLDNSNVFIEGKRYSAYKKGKASSMREAINDDIFDNSWRIDFGKLLECCGGYHLPIASAKLYGSRPPQNDSVWDMAKQHGFELLILNRSSSNKEKGVDTSITWDVCSDMHEHMQPGDHVILVTGDGDFTTVAQVKKKGMILNVYSWSHCLNSMLKDCAHRTLELEHFYDKITLSP